MNTEEWRDVPGFEGRYRVSSMGRVQSLSRIVTRADGSPLPLRERITSPKTTSDGKRLFTQLYVNGRPTPFTISVLVALVFIGPRPAGHDVCHNNGNPKDNRAENLRYGTRAENMADAILHGTTLRGLRNPSAKLTPDQVRSIRAKSGERASELAAAFGVSAATISDIRSGRRWGWIAIEAAERALKEP